METVISTEDVDAIAMVFVNSPNTLSHTSAKGVNYLGIPGLILAIPIDGGPLCCITPDLTLIRASEGKQSNSVSTMVADRWREENRKVKAATAKVVEN